ncbi:hypothetical protein DAI22_03g191700 [Oryza sativa Japonica Group]|nr:hypothetical protein DAI22_03g191700 [Oryza sativa Japonica Group]
MHRLEHLHRALCRLLRLAVAFDHGVVHHDVLLVHRVEYLFSVLVQPFVHTPDDQRRRGHHGPHRHYVEHPPRVPKRRVLHVGVHQRREEDVIGLDDRPHHAGVDLPHRAGQRQRRGQLERHRQHEHVQPPRAPRQPPHDPERLLGEAQAGVPRGEVVVRGVGRRRHSVEHRARVVVGAASEVEEEELDGEVVGGAEAGLE